MNHQENSVVSEQKSIFFLLLYSWTLKRRSLKNELSVRQKYEIMTHFPFCVYEILRMK